jgi:UDP-3-O-[3-hydroxymyristoyl] glucosamine N-acyltransferase
MNKNKSIFLLDYNSSRLLKLFLNIEYVQKVLGRVENGITINNVSHPLASQEGDLIWISESIPNAVDIIQNCDANFIVCSINTELSGLSLENKILILSSNPRASFAFLVTALLKDFEQNKSIHRTAIIGSNCTIGENVSIGSYSQIGNCIIGDNVIIGSNVVIHDNCIIGNDVIIKSGTVIGNDGYGFVQDKSGAYYKFPHLGNVIIDQNVEIGSNVCIDRASIGSTIIGMGSKIDNLVHIGHNVIIGLNVLIAASTDIGGSSKIGNNSKIWLGCKIADGIIIGESVNVGIGSVVISNIENNKKCFGNPARVFANNN